MPNHATLRRCLAEGSIELEPVPLLEMPPRRLDALHGRRALPERWVAGLLGRATDNDDGEVFRLTAAAVERWVG